MQRPWGGEGRGVLPAQALCSKTNERLVWLGWRSGRMEGGKGREAGETDPEGHSTVWTLRF